MASAEVFRYLSEKLPLSQKTTLLQSEPIPTALHCSLPSKFLYQRLF